MKSVDSTRVSAALTAAFVLPVFVSLTSCSSPSPREYTQMETRSEVGARESSYAVATTPDDLKRLIAEDLEARSASQVYAGLEAFVGENVSRGTAKRAHLLWAEVKPTTMLQYGQGRSVMTSVKQLGDVLANEGRKEMETAFETLRQGDFERVQRMRDEPMGIFHPSTAALSKEVRPYALLADGVLSYRDVAAAADPSQADVQSALSKLSLAQSELALVGETRGMFLADAAAAQSLERAGQIDAAAEYWMRIADSEEFLQQPEVMRHLVAARIKTYGVRMKERLVVEVEDERRRELRARDAQHSAQVAQLQDKHASFDSWAREGFKSSAARMSALSSEDNAQKAQLASLKEVALERDAELSAAQAALTARVAAHETQAASLGTEVAALAEDTAALAKADDVVADALKEIGDAAESAKERAAALERRAAGLEQADEETRAQLDSVANAAAEASAKADMAAGQADITAVRSNQLAAQFATTDAELAQTLRDFAAYREAVDGLTADASLMAMDSLLADGTAEGADAADIAADAAAPAKRSGGLTLPAYLAVHSVQDVFGVDGKMQQLSSFFIADAK